MDSGQILPPEPRSCGGLSAGDPGCGDVCPCRMQSGSHLVPSLGKTEVSQAPPAVTPAGRAGRPAGLERGAAAECQVDVEAVACALSFSFDGDALPGGRQNVV